MTPREISRDVRISFMNPKRFLYEVSCFVVAQVSSETCLLDW
jgi:hypothetical protein